MPEKELTKEKYLNRKRALEISCYVVGAGAFGVFVRWLQVMMAFNEEGLVDKSFFNFAVPAFCIAAALVFLRFVDRLRLQRFYLPEDFYSALRNEHKLFTLLRWVIGLVMSVGGLMLLISAEVDKNAEFLQILAVLGIINGLLFPFHLTSANKPHAAAPAMSCFCAFWPILVFCFWLICTYKINAINSVLWAYGPEIITHIIVINAFYYVAGFSFGKPNPWRCMFFCMMGAALCIMVIADERYMGMQLMYGATAAMLTMYNWIMLENLRQHDEEEEEKLSDGFDRLDEAERAVRKRSQTGGVVTYPTDKINSSEFK